MTTKLAHSSVHYGHGTDNAWDEALALLCGRLGIAPEKIEFVLSARLTQVERRELVRLVERRIVHRMPVPYLVGEAWFAGRRYLIEPGVLIPRSPIAELIASEFAPWLTRFPDRILDLCTGSGCIGIACAHAFPYAEVVLSDIDDCCSGVGCAQCLTAQRRRSCVRGPRRCFRGTRCFDVRSDRHKSPIRQCGRSREHARGVPA